MNDSFFAGAFGSDGSKLPPQTRLECKICWYVYDPALGDEGLANTSRHGVFTLAGALELPGVRH